MTDNNFHYEVNPCEACRKRYDITDINNINQCCYDTFAAFQGVSSINEIRNSPQAKNCIKCVEDSKKAMGRDLCEFRLPAYPVWTQSPHYFPDLFYEERDVKKAKEKCLQMCNETQFYKNECVDNCITDANAVVEFPIKKIDNKNLKKLNFNTENFDNLENFQQKMNDKNKQKKQNKQKNLKDTKIVNTDDDSKNINLTEFYVSFIICSLIFIIFIIMFLKILLN